MPSAAKLAQGALEYTPAIQTSRIARATVPTETTLRSSTTAAASERAAIADSLRDAMIACQTERPSFRLGVRKKAASRRISPRRQASDTTQLSANQTRIALTESASVQWAVARIAHSALPTPVTRNST